MENKKTQTTTNNSQKDGVKYSGQVSVNIVNKGKILNKFKLKNKGLSDLFKGICLYLCNRSNGVDYIPSKIDLIDGNEDSLLTVPSTITSRKIGVLSGVSDDEYNYVSFNAVIFNDQIKGVETSNKYLVLKDAKGNSLAKVSANKIQLSEGLAAVIEWRLYIYDFETADPEDFTTTTQSEGE